MFGLVIFLALMLIRQVMLRAERLLAVLALEREEVDEVAELR